MANTGKVKKKEFVPRHGELSLGDRYYIENHGYDSPEQLALDLNKPLEAIKEYFDWLAHQPKAPKEKPANKLMSRDKGVVSMNEAASSIGDEARRHVTKDAIIEAQKRGDVNLVANLQKLYDQQQADQKDIIKSKYQDRIHYIITPDADEAVY